MTLLRPPQAVLYDGARYESMAQLKRSTGMGWERIYRLKEKGAIVPVETPAVTPDAPAAQAARILAQARATHTTAGRMALLRQLWLFRCRHGAGVLEVMR